MLKKAIVIFIVVAILLAALPPAVNAVAPPKIIIKTYRLQVRGDRPHSLGACVRQPVKHFHIELFLMDGKGRGKYIRNLHIGSYIQGARKCYVAWDPYRPVCVKSCGYDKGNNIRYVVKEALVDIGQIVGVVIGVAVLYAIVNVVCRALAPAL